MLHTCSVEEAHLQIRQLEARGDFKYKGISRLFEIIEKMTTDFWVKHQLPSVDLLCKSVDLKEDKVLTYLDALLVGRSPIVRKITIIEANPKNDGNRGVTALRTHDVFCRPTKKDTDTAKSYVEEYNRRTMAVLKEFFTKNYKSMTSSQMREYLHGNIASETFGNTYLSELVKNLFESSFDNTAELKKIQNETTIKPIVRQLVKDRVFFFAKNQSDVELAIQSILLVQNKDELMSRFEILSEYFENNILSFLLDRSIITQGDVLNIQEELGEDEHALATRDLMNLVLNKRSSLSPIHYQIVSELVIFVPHVISSQRKDTQEKKRKKLEDIVKMIEHASALIDLNVHRFDDGVLDETMANAIMNQPEILSTEFAVGKKAGKFVAHNQNLEQLVQSAQRALEVRKNPNELRILLQMGVEDLLDDGGKKKVKGLEYQYLVRYLNVFRKLMLYLFRRKPSPDLLEQIRKALDVSQAQDLSEAHKHETQAKVKEMEKELQEKEKKQKELEKAQAKEDKERAKEELKEARSAAPDEPDDTLSPEEKAQREAQIKEKEELNRQILEQMINVIDTAWRNGEMPNRITLNDKFTDFNENQIINFLKRESKGKIRSFMVRYDDERFRWPILISADYIKKNGNKMLAEAKKKADEQRNSQFPNQEQFEVNDALESFLTKLLSKSAVK